MATHPRPAEAPAHFTGVCLLQPDSLCLYRARRGPIGLECSEYMEEGCNGWLKRSILLFIVVLIIPNPSCRSSHCDSGASHAETINCFCQKIYLVNSRIAGKAPFPETGLQSCLPSPRDEFPDEGGVSSWLFDSRLLSCCPLLVMGAEAQLGRIGLSGSEPGNEAGLRGSTRYYLDPADITLSGFRQ